MNRGSDSKIRRGARSFSGQSVKRMTGLYLAILTLSACGTVARRVEISSTPTGASVRTAQGQVLGVTPVTLESDTLALASSSGMVSVVLNAPGHLERELLLELHAASSHQVNLTPARPELFRESLLSTHAVDINALTREILQIHGLIINRRSTEAEKRIADFQKSYPSIAAPHVMLAQIFAKQGKVDEAKKELLRALSLDPRDPVASRSLLGVTPESNDSQKAPAETSIAAPEAERKPAETYPASETEVPAPAPSNQPEGSP